MLWKGGEALSYSNDSTGVNKTQVPPLIFMPKVAYFAQYFLVYALKMQISAYMFQKWPWRIKFKKKIQVFGESCDFGGPDPPPP